MDIRSGRLTGKAYYYAFLACAKRILENQKELRVIFAQFLHGIGAESCGSHEISVAHFGRSVRAAVRTMYEAIAEPKEGTMITVIRKWAESVASPKEESESFLKILTRAQARAVEALQETRYRLEAMRRAKVVDAGSLHAGVGAVAVSFLLEG